MILSTLDKSRKGGAYEQIPSLVLGQRWTPQLNSRNMMKVVLCVWIEPYIENDLSFCVWPVHTPTTSKEVLTLSASTSPLPYTGNKSCIVNTILSVMPKHTVYIDPCMGSAEVFFRIRLCNRPFATIEEMDETLIRNWNAKVTNGDTVYILGDLLFRNEKPAEEYLKQLKGKKHPIIGNHDRDWVKKCNLEDFFESVNNLHFISDGKRQMTLCHYPMMSWPHMTRCYMVFGHIHGNTDADYWPLIRENDLMLNAGADVNGFAPVTFEEMQENNYRHKAGWNPELCTMEADQ